MVKVIAKFATIARAATGKKLSKQTYNILNKILEVDRCMKQVKQERVFEVHPELCFWAINGKRAIELSKKKREGFRERFRRLEQILPREAIEEALARFPRSRVGRDDVLDALVAAHTARLYVEGRFQRLPALPPTDRRRLRMEMIIAF
jgi:predicted RNase H-like nuclease